MFRQWLIRLPAFIVMFGLAAPSTIRAAEVDDVLADLQVPWLSPSTTRPTEPRKEGSEKSAGKNEDGKEEEIETDRDSFTFATTTTPVGRMILESAYSFIDNRHVPDSHSYPEMISRYGVTKNLELRLGWNYEVGGGGDVSNGDAAGDLSEPGVKKESQLTYGFKYVVTRQQAWMPESACIVQQATPTSGPDLTGRTILGYAFGWTIFEKCKLDSAIRYENMKEESDHFNQWAPSVVLKVPVFEHWTVHGEYFGIFTQGRADNSNAQYLSPGIHYLITPACEVGVRVGWGVNQDAANFFSNVGFGLMF